MTTTSSAADDARDLPAEPTAPWILVLAGGVILAWLGVLAWQVAVLPERVPTHFAADGRADGWSSRTGAAGASLSRAASSASATVIAASGPSRLSPRPAPTASANLASPRVSVESASQPSAVR